MSRPSRAATLVAASAAVLALVAGIALLGREQAQPGDERVTAAPMQAASERPSSSAAPGAGATAERVGEGEPLLPPLIGEPRGTGTPLCDEASWAGVAELVRSADAGEVVFDEATWQRMSAGTRGGVASWLSKCRQDGRAIRILGSESGALLATYDGRSGLELAE